MNAHNGRRLVQGTAWLALFAGLLVIYLSYVLFDFFPPAVGGARFQIYFLNFAGIALGAALCPLFLPLPRAPSGGIFFLLKRPWVSAAFILVVILPNIIVRSLGIPFWLGSMPARVFMALSSGMIQPIGFGLFFLSQLQAPLLRGTPLPRGTPRPSGPRSPNRTGPYASFLLAAALMCSVVIRTTMIPLLEYFGLAADPWRAMTLLFNALKWIVLCGGLSASVCVLAMGQEQGMVNNEEETEHPPVKANLIARFIGLAAIFFFLNPLLDMRLFPLISGAAEAWMPYFPAAVPVVLLLGFLAGRSALFVNGKTGPFLRLLLIPLIMLFILLPALHFLNAEYPLFALVMNSLVFITHFTVWSIFSTALVELNRKRSLFYASAMAILLTSFFAFISPLIGPFIPRGPGFMVLASAVVALLFTLLAFRVLFPDLPLLAEKSALPENAETPEAAREAVFSARGLTEREKEVARLIVEGLSNTEIAGRLFVSESSISFHITNIYRKFAIEGKSNGRAAFLSEVLTGEGGRSRSR
ncbi:hypothetical protein AGMMS50268_17880 [Spirochaetia bacterium]|nr:hypothetical protein AGMMS50268_17880 [Spirochaetia bacterium]